jgi:hypothetical protein
MKILNRPMFKYGGPIKEGVMHGMRDGGRIGFQDGTKKRNYNWFETPVGSIFDPKGIALGGKKMIAGAYDLGGVPLNALSRMVTGYNPGFSGAKFTGIKPDKPNTAYWMGIPTSTKEGWEIESMKEGPTAAEIELAKLKKELADQKKGTMPGNLGTKAWIDPSKAEALAKDSQNKRIKSYLDMMGYDQAKKGALSKALIDASAIVQQGTEEAGSLKESDWGKLINQAIQTTSRRLEKPEQIREAVGLMATKAMIEKDLEDPQVKKLRALSIEEKEKVLGGLSIGEIVPSVLKASGKSRADAEVMKNVMSVKEPDIIPTVVGKKDDLQDIKDSLDEGVTVEDYIVEKYKGEEGIYIIDNVVVQIYPDGTSKQLY